MMGTKHRFLIWFHIVSFVSFGQEFFLGTDLSYVNELEDCGVIYRDRSGNATDPYELFKDEGSDIVRLRLWHDPEWTNYSNLEDVKVSISRAKSHGMAVMLDFHYSDFWADPGRQWRPGAWEHIESDEILSDSVYNYTKRVLLTLHELNLLPEYIQIGNETNGNILLSRNGSPIDLSHDSRLYPVNWPRQVKLLQSGIDAVNELNQNLQTNMKTLIHVSDPAYADSWFQLAISNGLKDFDIIGLSYYPQWHKLGVRELASKVADLTSQFGKAVMIVETGYPWTSSGQDQANNILNFDSRLFTYSNTFSIETQQDFLIELSWLVRENGGWGVIYWEPAWVSSSCQSYWATGSHYENATLFDFDGKIHNGANFLSYDYNQMPAPLNDQLVTFKVDMTHVEIENGVYVTGSFTGENWVLLPMSLSTGSFYELTAAIPGRSEGAYIFYNNNNWSNAYREKVPEACARRWGTHREYRVKGEQTEYYFSWSRCDQLPNAPVLGFKKESATVFLYPSITQNEIFVESQDEIINLEILNASGKVCRIFRVAQEAYDVSDLSSGLYLIKVQSKFNTAVLRFIKE